jgi:hypothetical protein
MFEFPRLYPASSGFMPKKQKPAINGLLAGRRGDDRQPYAAATTKISRLPRSTPLQLKNETAIVTESTNEPRASNETESVKN